MKDYIEAYISRGFSIIPIHYRTKIPAVGWKPYTAAHPTQDEVSAWFLNGDERNVGIVTGGISGIVAIDIDGEAGLEQLARYG
jgi:hypothetical protein